MPYTSENIETYFTYYPPTSEWRKTRHSIINIAALNFANSILRACGDEESAQRAIDAVQTARMLANQGITVIELKQQGKV